MKFLDRHAVQIGREVVAVLREELEGSGFAVSDIEDDSPYAQECHDAGAYSVVSKGEEIIADVRVEIPCSNGYDGEHLGWGFGFACTAYGGRIGPGGIFHNYTDQVWTRDREEIHARLSALSDHAGEYGAGVADWIIENEEELIAQAG